MKTTLIRAANTGDIYIDRAFRGKGVGSILLESLEEIAKEKDFYKIVLFTYPFNQNGQGLYHKLGYREVGVFENKGSWMANSSML